MQDWSRGDLLGLLAAVIGIIAAVAVIDVINRRWLRRLLLVLLTATSVVVTYAIVVNEALRAKVKTHDMEVAVKQAAVDAATVNGLAREIAIEAERKIAIDEARRLATEKIERQRQLKNLSEARSKIVGRWDGPIWAGRVEFSDTGAYSNSSGYITVRGSYRFVDDQQIEVIIQNPLLPWIRNAALWRVQVSDDQLRIISGAGYTGEYTRIRG